MGLMDHRRRKARRKVDATLGLDLTCDQQDCDRPADGTFIVRHHDGQVCTSGTICAPHALNIYAAATQGGARVTCIAHGTSATMEALGDFRP